LRWQHARALALADLNRDVRMDIVATIEHPRGVMKKGWLTVAWLLCLPGYVHSQDVAVGNRVRVGTPTMRPRVGLLLASTNDSILVSFSNPAMMMAIARDKLNSLQVSLGGDGWRGAILGAQMGLPAGATAFGIQHLRSRKPPPRFHYDRGDLYSAALTGAVWGFVAGGALGVAIGQERWAHSAVPSPNYQTLPTYEERLALLKRARLALFQQNDRIRLQTRDGKQTEGRYDGQIDDFVRIMGDSSYVVPINDVVAIFERRPLTGAWMRRGMLIGAALGLGTIAAAALSEGNDCSGSCVSTWSYTVSFGFVGALTGGTIGAIAGSHVKGWTAQKW
jgi:hypothetical protein